MARLQDGCGPPLGVGAGAAGHAFRRLRPSHDRRPLSRRRLPLELDVAFLLNARLLDRSIATIWPFMLASSAAVCLSPPTKNAAGQNTTIAAAVTKPSFDRWLSWAPESAAARCEIP